MLPVIVQCGREEEDRHKSARLEVDNFSFIQCKNSWSIEALQGQSHSVQSHMRNVGGFDRYLHYKFKWTKFQCMS